MSSRAVNSMEELANDDCETRMQEIARKKGVRLRWRIDAVSGGHESGSL